MKIPTLIRTTSWLMFGQSRLEQAARTSINPIGDGSAMQTGDGKPYKVSGHGAASVILDDDKKFIYVIGGLDSSDTPTSRVLRAKVGSDGIISRWDDLGMVEDMPGTWLLTAVAEGWHLYILGETTTPPGTFTSSKKVYIAQVNDDGSLEWYHSLPDLPVPLHAHANVASQSERLYVVGGISNDTAQKNIYFIQLLPSWLSFEKRGEPSRRPPHLWRHCQLHAYAH